MANGTDAEKQYNPGWCNERHKRIDQRFKDVEDEFTKRDHWIEKLDARIWLIVIMAGLQLCGLIGILVQNYLP